MNKQIFEGDNYNPFNNKSGPAGDLNTGNRSKFNATQMEERTRLHAIGISHGYPRVADIVDIVKEKYNIDITEVSERTWRKNNYGLIVKKQQEMIDKGEIEVTIIGPRAISENLQVLIGNNLKLLKRMGVKINECLEKVNDDTHAEIEGMKIKKAKNDALERVSVLSDAYSKLNNGVTKQLDTLLQISGIARGLKKENEEEEYKERVNAPRKGFDPSKAEISDEHRALIDEELRGLD